MTVRLERNPDWWIKVARHPAVEPMLGPMSDADLAEIVTRRDVLPMAAEHGGFLFARLDQFGRVYELHTMFTPEGWGREVHRAAKTAFDHIFARGGAVVVTSEMEANPRSQPPRTFGFQPCGEFASSPLGSARTWVLTCDAWARSPAWRSKCR